MGECSCFVVCEGNGRRGREAVMSIATNPLLSSQAMLVKALCHFEATFGCWPVYFSKYDSMQRLHH